MTSRALVRANERFHHIDFKHFKKGERIDDWLPEHGNLTKRQQREEEEEERKMKSRSQETSIRAGGHNEAHGCGGPPCDDIAIPDTRAGSHDENSQPGTAQNPVPLDITLPDDSSSVPSPHRTNQRKRKRTAPHPTRDAQQQHQTTKTPRAKRQPKSKSAVDDPGQLALAGLADAFVGKNHIPESQNFVYCVRSPPLFVLGGRMSANDR